YKFLELGERPATSDYLNNQVLNEIEYHISNHDIHPTVYISYSRKAFFAKNDNDFRITFDSNIITRRDNLFLEDGSFGDRLLDKKHYLMEVKILGAIPVWFTKILSDLEIYNTHFSKYGNEYMRYCLNKNYDTGRKDVC
uniref:VTC domain-containing protein n=1 Tax=Clostridium tertium TaxID=1559 RepID=UPI00331BA730